jgi:DNA-binding transcriptional ArsR family regulator
VDYSRRAEDGAPVGACESEYRAAELGADWDGGGFGAGAAGLARVRRRLVHSQVDRALLFSGTEEPGRHVQREAWYSDFYPLIYALTRICSVEYIKRVESVFEIIAEPNRRAILSLLVSSEQSVGEIERQLRMSQPAVSKHLRVLRDAGFVESTVDAQRRLYRLKPEPLREMDAWLAQFRRFWSAHVDALERHLDRMDDDRKGRDSTDQKPPKKRKTK